MGTDRGKCETESPSEIFRSIRSFWEVDEQELYRIWIAYNNRQVINKGDARKTINQLLKHDDFYPPETLNYFMAMGFEMFNREYLKEIENERATTKNKTIN